MNKKVLFSPCHYIYDAEGGSELSWAFNIVHRLASKNKNSLVITGRDKNKITYFYKVIEVQKKKKSLDLSFKNAIIFNLKYFLETIRQFNLKKFSILHHVLPFGIDNTFNLFVLLCPFFYKKKPIFIIGPIQSPLTYNDLDLDVSDIKSGKPSKKKFINFGSWVQKNLRFFLSFLSQKTLKNADKIVVINKYTKKMLLERFIPEEKIAIIPPGIDVEKFIYSKTKKKKDSLDLITVGYLLERKGIDLVLLAIEELVRRDVNILYHIVGNGPQRKNLEKIVIEKNLKNNVIFHGFVPNFEVQTLYNKADIFVSMTRSESWGQMYLEAMACGLPVITTKNIGSNEIIQNGEFGFLIEQESVDQLIEKIDYFIDNPQFIEVFGKRARKEVEDKYDWDSVVIPEYQKLYEKFSKK